MARRLPVYRPGVKMVRFSELTLKWTGFVLVCLSSFSVAILQRGILRLDGDASMEALSEAMKPGGQAMGWVTGAVFCSMAAALAIPVYAKLLYEGWKRTEGGARLLLELAALALVSEIPYDFAMNGKILDLGTQNPVWGLLLAAIALEITKRWRMKTILLDGAFRALIVFAAVLWSLLLRVYMGYVLVLLAVLFCFAAKWEWITTLGGVILTLLQFPAPIGMALVRWYDGEKEERGSKWLYALYPLQLAVFGVIAAFIAA